MVEYKLIHIDFNTMVQLIHILSALALSGISLAAPSNGGGGLQLPSRGIVGTTFKLTHSCPTNNGVFLSKMC